MSSVSKNKENLKHTDLIRHEFQNWFLGALGKENTLLLSKHNLCEVKLRNVIPRANTMFYACNLLN